MARTAGACKPKINDGNSLRVGVTGKYQKQCRYQEDRKRSGLEKRHCPSLLMSIPDDELGIGQQIVYVVCGCSDNQPHSSQRDRGGDPTCQRDGRGKFRRAPGSKRSHKNHCKDDTHHNQGTDARNNDCSCRHVRHRSMTTPGRDSQWACLRSEPIPYSLRPGRTVHALKQFVWCHQRRCS